MEETKYTPEALARLPRQELRRILTVELHKTTEQIDGDFVRLLLAELNGRGSDPDYIDDDAVEAACGKFRQNTIPMQKPRKHWYQSWMLKVASVALVLGILFFALPAAAEAGRVKDVLGWWSDSVFRVFAPGEKPVTRSIVYQTDHPGLQEIYDTVTELGITQQIVPQELSEEFELIELKVVQMLDDTSIHAWLTDQHNDILFNVILHSEQATLQHEKTAENVSVWDLSGVEHYVISNSAERIVTWVAGNIECTVTSDCLEEEVYNFIKSIYTLEG